MGGRPSQRRPLPCFCRVRRSILRSVFVDSPFSRTVYCSRNVGAPFLRGFLFRVTTYVAPARVRWLSFVAIVVCVVLPGWRRGPRDSPPSTVGFSVFRGQRFAEVLGYYGTALTTKCRGVHRFLRNKGWCLRLIRIPVAFATARSQGYFHRGLRGYRTVIAPVVPSRPALYSVL